jgi:hypothetical protein
MPTTRQPSPSEEFLVRSSHAQFRMRRRRKFINIVVLVSLVILACAIFFGFRQETRIAGAKYLWVQMMPDEEGTPGGRLVRAIVSRGGDCPVITQDGKTTPMNPRPAAVRAAFPILLCENVIVARSDAWVGSQLLPARPVEPNDIVVLGDTGCRMVYWQIQPCRSVDDWPFAKIASIAAGKLSDQQGQSFILHLGDLHYREHQCADSSSRCGGSPFGDNWETWEKEFFEPAQPLLLSAPWIIMRGNHEDCNRAGAGWVFLFALPGRQKTADACDSEPISYNVSIGKTEETPSRSRILLVIDTSDEKNTYKIEERCKQYMKLLEPLDKTGPEYWLAMHQPLWLRELNGRPQKPAASAKRPCKKTGSAITAIRDKFEARQNERLARVTLAGDTHAFQFFWPKTASTPIQIIAGNGGTALDTLCKAEKREKTDEKCKDKRDDEKANDTYRQINGPTKVPDQDVKSYGIDGSSLTFVEHGFTVMHRNASTWTATEFGSDGRNIAACRFSEALVTETSSDKLPGCDSSS